MKANRIPPDLSPNANTTADVGGVVVETVCHTAGLLPSFLLKFSVSYLSVKYSTVANMQSPARLLTQCTKKMLKIVVRSGLTGKEPDLIST